MTEELYIRAQLLFQQGKYKEAENILLNLLSSDPDDESVLALMAQVKMQLDDYKKAEELINSALAINPESAYFFFIKAQIYIHNETFDDAESTLKQAITLDPLEADYYAALASIKLWRKKFEAALELANQALEHESDNLMALNVRSTALYKLDRKEDAFESIEGALNNDPNNSHTHANYGWSLLEKGDHKKALEHFGEALKNNPNNRIAQAGMAEALKARYLLYRLFLKYSFWIGNLTAKYQWGVILGFYFGSKLIMRIAETSETLRPFLMPVIVLLALIAFSTWVMTPVGNLFLRLNKYGKHLLDKNEIMNSNFVGLSVFVFALGGLSYLLTGNTNTIGIMFFGFSMMIPCSRMFSETKYKNALLIYTAIMALIGFAAIYTGFKTGNMFENDLSSAYLIALIAFQWVANFLSIKESNR